MFLEERRKKYEYIDSLVQTVQTVQTFSEDTVMEFEVKKYGVTTLEKVVTTEEIKLSGRKVMKEIDDAGYKYLSIPRYDKMKQTEMKEIRGYK